MERKPITILRQADLLEMLDAIEDKFETNFKTKNRDYKMGYLAALNMFERLCVLLAIQTMEIKAPRVKKNGPREGS